MKFASTLVKNRTIKITLFALSTISAAVGILFICEAVFRVPLVSQFMLYETAFVGEHFSSERWVHANDCEGLSGEECADQEASCPRGPMVRDLLESHLVPNRMNRKKVTSLLGSKEYETSINGKSCDAYSLGMCTGFRIDYDALYICYDENDILSSAGHIQH